MLISLAERKSTLVFCVNIDHVHALTRTFRNFGIDARGIDSQTGIAERKSLISQFKQGEFPILVNCGLSTLPLSDCSCPFTKKIAILTEGTDIPNIDCVVLARPTRSPNVYAQMVSPTPLNTTIRLVDRYRRLDEECGYPPPLERKIAALWTL